MTKEEFEKSIQKIKDNYNKWPEPPRIIPNQKLIPIWNKANMPQQITIVERK